jgi:hypothetical protein
MSATRELTRRSMHSGSATDETVLKMTFGRGCKGGRRSLDWDHTWIHPLARTAQQCSEH